MGRFDALQQLDKKPDEPTPPLSLPIAPPTPDSTLPLPNPTLSPQEKENPIKPKSRKHAPVSNSVGAEKPEKYTTKVKPSIIRLIRVLAAQSDINDYDVVEQALLRFFEKNKI